MVGQPGRYGFSVLGVFRKRRGQLQWPERALVLSGRPFRPLIHCSAGGLPELGHGVAHSSTSGGVADRSADQQSISLCCAGRSVDDVPACQDLVAATQSVLRPDVAIRADLDSAYTNRGRTHRQRIRTAVEAVLHSRESVRLEALGQGDNSIGWSRWRPRASGLARAPHAIPAVSLSSAYSIPWQALIALSQRLGFGLCPR